MAIDRSDNANLKSVDMESNDASPFTQDFHFCCACLLGSQRVARVAKCSACLLLLLPISLLFILRSEI